MISSIPSKMSSNNIYEREAAVREVIMSCDIVIKDLKVYFETSEGQVRAVDGVSLHLAHGKTVGLIGETGSGKSVLGLSILGLLADNALLCGQILYKNQNLLSLETKKIRRLRGKEIALIPQNPGTALNPRLKVGTQITEALTLHKKYTKKQAREFALQLLEELKLPSPHKNINAYPFELSGGMKQRILAAMGISCAPLWLIADEPTKGLDAVLRIQVFELMQKIMENTGAGMLLITHDLLLAKKLCAEVAVMYAGQIIEQGESQAIFENPKHPYTIGLIAAQPVKSFRPMMGFSPSLTEPPTGCKFHPRCKCKMARCSEENPDLFEGGSGVKVRCFLFAES